MARLGKSEQSGAIATEVKPNILQRGYAAILKKVLDYPWTAALISVAIAGLAGSAFTELESEILPTEDRGKINMFARGPAGVGLPYTERQADQIEAIFQPYLDSGIIDRLYSVAGRWDPNIIYLVGTLKPWESAIFAARNRGRDSTATQPASRCYSPRIREQQP